MGEVDNLIKEVSPVYEGKNKGPDAKHKLVYDSPGEGLEPAYFFIIDLMKEMNLTLEKLYDNFTSSPGSGHFGELGQRLSIMQQQGSKLLGDINTVLRSVLNLIYDLKEFKTRLEHYKSLKSKNPEEVRAAKLSLKQIWLDKVDIQKGNSSIKGMTFNQNMQFITLLDAFLAADSLNEAEKLDLNERVKRIVIPRIQEFETWVIQSEKELSKRYKIERSYLRSQVNSLKLYAKWAKPYLKAAQELEMSIKGKEADLVKVFNTILLELTLLGTREIDIKSLAKSGDVPLELANMDFKRKYFACVLVDFRFRGIPQKTGQHQHYAFGGRVEAEFKSYCLNEEELDLLHQKMDESDMGEAFRLIDGATTDSLEQLQEEINFFLEEEDEELKPKKNDSNNANPLLALFGFYEGSSGDKPKKDKKGKSEKKKITEAKKDNYLEAEFIRKLGIKDAEETAFNLFDVYKKAHQMATFP